MARTGIDYLQSERKGYVEKAAASVIGSALLGPALFATVVMAVEHGDPYPIFRQTRVAGPTGAWDIRKLRTIKRQHTESGPYVSYGTEDPRASRIGNFIRRASLDEAIQVVDVLKGEMWMYGPNRAVAPEDAQRLYESVPDLADEHQELTRNVKPSVMSPSSIWRRGLKGPITDPVSLREIDRISVELDLALYGAANFKDDMRFYRSLPSTLASCVLKPTEFVRSLPTHEIVQLPLRTNDPIENFSPQHLAASA